MKTHIYYSIGRMLAAGGERSAQTACHFVALHTCIHYLINDAIEIELCAHCSLCVIAFVCAALN